MIFMPQDINMASLHQNSHVHYTNEVVYRAYISKSSKIDSAEKLIMGFWNLMGLRRIVKTISALP